MGMNERIDQLLVKAGAYFGGEGVEYSNFDPKKFAELIVRECSEKCLDMKYTNPQPHHYSVMLKEHFGVEV
jgi:hypothetical protein